jgi:hypothetical protein
MAHEWPDVVLALNRRRSNGEFLPVGSMAQRTKELARNHKTVLPEKPIVPATPHMVLGVAFLCDLRPFPARAALLFLSYAVCWR